ncbi:hypothetical protein SAMN05518865_106237 [Duganella sp. CF458]|uniref:hypothetical protein n=1 Tax=Duganella sp. CF458 TaxID=1884368 RepID=UPI0008EA60BF|nr:hypothetical protein [Duganella sp. CF458]SFF94927.1 hypothetical protein SAMN05518865_106237 [Duganella sp. CF458]
MTPIMSRAQFSLCLQAIRCACFAAIIALGVWNGYMLQYAATSPTVLRLVQVK